MRRYVTVGGIVVTAMLAGSIAAAAEPRAVMSRSPHRQAAWLPSTPGRRRLPASRLHRWRPPRQRNRRLPASLSRAAPSFPADR